jgi:hypothetical protein
VPRASRAARRLDDDLGPLRGEVLGLEGIVDVVVELEVGAFCGGTRAPPLDESLACLADGAAEPLAARDRVVRGVADALRRVFEHRQQAAPVDRLRAGGRGNARELGECREDIDRLGDRARARAGLRRARCNDDEQDPVRLFVVGVPRPRAVVAEVEAMVATEDDEGARCEPERSSSSMTRPTCASMKLSAA